MKSSKSASFKKTVWDHYLKQGRDLPWRISAAAKKKPTPYHIVVSEIMLQQTQVDRVSPYYGRFIKEFPTFQSLAKAPVSRVLRMWQGLGYNRRALSLHKLAQMVTEKHKGKLPKSIEELDALPGIGPGTAGSLSAFVFNRPVPFIETNIRRAFIHYFFSGKKKVRDKEILKLVEETMDRRNPREWYYALMDYGSFLGRKMENPNRRSAHYSRQSKFQGSNRQLRGALLRLLLQEPKATERQLIAVAGSKTKLARVLGELEKEGFLR